jgi:TRAP-type C4-dicarboxylate transport system permease small subunit
MVMSEAAFASLRKAFRFYAKGMEILAASSLALIVVITTTQILYRYFLSGSLVWAEELSRCLLVWICFLFLGVSYQRGEIAYVDLINRLPLRLRAALMIPAMAITVIFLCVIAYYGVIYAYQNTAQTIPGLNMLLKSITGSTAGVSIFWVYLSIPIGMVLLSLHIIAFAIRLFAEAFHASGDSLGN